MRKTLLLQDFNTSPDYLEDIHKSLETIHNQLLTEIASKQATINLLEEKLNLQEIESFEKNSLIKELSKSLAVCKKSAEGNRQLVNKLLTDIGRLNQDIDWYKRTYEQRSILGTLKEKIFRRRIFK